MLDRTQILKILGIEAQNPGAYGGGWFTTQEKPLSSINPADEQVIADVVPAGAQDYQAVITAAQQAFMQWRTVPAPQRGEVIRQIANRLRELKSPLGSLVAMETGKSKGEGDGEVQEMIDIADFAVGQSRMLYGKTMHSERPEHRMYEQWHPYGVVGVISAFNFPVAVWAWNAFIAAICGNSVVWKPSRKTPLCALAVQRMVNEVLAANNAPNIFNVFIPTDHALAEQFIADEQVPLISFTGSCRTGRHVAQVVAGRLGRSILELGGNNAIIVDETADLELVLPAVVFGAIGTAGQRCTSTRRIFVQETIYQTVLTQLVAAYQQINIGDPLDSNNHMGPLIDQQAVDDYQAALQRVQALGGSIAYGNRVLPGPGYYVQPTIVTDVKNDWDIVQQETFAPIVYVMPYSTLEEAVALHNQVCQGLSSALFTTHLRHAEYFLSHIGSDCGIANVNIGTSGAEVGGAFGGEKETGGGRESGSDAWQSYMRRQTNTINWGKQLPLAQGIEFTI